MMLKKEIVQLEQKRWLYEAQLSSSENIYSRNFKIKRYELTIKQLFQILINMNTSKIKIKINCKPSKTGKKSKIKFKKYVIQYILKYIQIVP